MKRARPTDDDVAIFAGAVARLGVTDPSSLSEVTGLLHVRELETGEHLLQAGEQASLVGVLASGLLREYFVNAKGVERTKSFVCPHQFTGSLADLLSSRPSRASIAAETPARVVLLGYAQLRALYATSRTWSTAAQHSAEHLVVYKAEREYQFLCLDAEQRYEAFLQQHPDLESRVAGRHIASYLGITPVHLSRLRARRVRRAEPKP